LSEQQAKELRRVAERYDGKPYDVKFAWDYEKIYSRS